MATFDRSSHDVLQSRALRTPAAECLRFATVCFLLYQRFCVVFAKKIKELILTAKHLDMSNPKYMIVSKVPRNLRSLQQYAKKQLCKIGFQHSRTICGVLILERGTTVLLCGRHGNIREARQSVSFLDMLACISSVVRHQLRHPVSTSKT